MNQSTGGRRTRRESNGHGSTRDQRTDNLTTLQSECDKIRGRRRFCRKRRKRERPSTDDQSKIKSTHRKFRRKDQKSVFQRLGKTGEWESHDNDIIATTLSGMNENISNTVSPGKNPLKVESTSSVDREIARFLVEIREVADLRRNNTKHQTEETDLLSQTGSTTTDVLAQEDSTITDTFGQTCWTTTDTLKPAKSAVTDTLDQTVSMVTNTLNRTGSTVTYTLKPAKSAVTDTLNQTVSMATNTLNQTGSTVTDTLKPAKSAVTDTLNQTVFMVTNTLNQTGSTVTDTFDQTGSTVTDKLNQTDCTVRNNIDQTHSTVESELEFCDPFYASESDSLELVAGIETRSAPDAAKTDTCLPDQTGRTEHRRSDKKEVTFCDQAFPSESESLELVTTRKELSTLPDFTKTDTCLLGQSGFTEIRDSHQGETTCCDPVYVPWSDGSEMVTGIEPCTAPDPTTTVLAPSGVDAAEVEDWLVWLGDWCCECMQTNSASMANSSGGCFSESP